MFAAGALSCVLSAGVIVSGFVASVVRQLVREVRG
jgi:hypothetical protein